MGSIGWFGCRNRLSVSVSWSLHLLPLIGVGCFELDGSMCHMQPW